MLLFPLSPILIVLCTLALSLGLTYLVREAAHRLSTRFPAYNFVAKPKSDRWHKRPTAMMGGVAIYLATLITYLLFIPQTVETWVIIGASTFLFLVGLIDDLLHIKPYQKLIGQLVGAAIIIGYGLVLPWTEFQVLNIFITAFWLVGVTNALNLLDNMDGLAAGIAAIAATAVAFTLGVTGATESGAVLLIAAFIGALIGFLRFNFNPASIFMGDCGSLFIGFFLASSVLLANVGGQSRSIISVLAVPVLTLFVPIFDTTFVTVLRKLWGRSASQGGRDHTSHRLVALGLSERSAVLMLYGFAIIAGGLALLVRQVPVDASLALIGGFSIVLTLVGVYLAKVKVYQEQDDEAALRDKKVFGFLVDLTHKRRLFEVILDVMLITLSYYAAYALLFGSLEGESYDLFLKTLPIVATLKLAAFLAGGVYRGIWRYTGIDDLMTFTKATALGTILTVLAVLLIYRFEGFSRTVFVLDGLLLLIALAASRMAFRLFRQVLPTPQAAGGRKVLIYGADDGGELVLRELHSNRDLGYNPIGFVDDDPMKKGKVIHGLRVLGGNGSIPEICRQHQVVEVLMPNRHINPQRLRELREECETVEVELKRAAFRVESFGEFE